MVTSDDNDGEPLLELPLRHIKVTADLTDLPLDHGRDDDEEPPLDLPLYPSPDF